MIQYSVGSALFNVFAKNVEGSTELAELAVSVNTILFRNSQENVDFREPVVRVKSNKYRDILNLAVTCLFIKNKELVSLIRLQLLENSTTKQNPELELLISEESMLKLFLINIVEKKGYNYLFSLINFKCTKDNKKNILTLVKITSRPLGSEKRYIPEKRRIGVGYRDKGSLPLPGSSQVFKANIEPRERQFEIEKHRKQLQDTSNFIKGYLM